MADYDTKRGIRMSKDLLDRIRYAVRWYKQTHDQSFSLDQFCRDALEAHLKRYQHFIGGNRRWHKPLQSGRPRLRPEKKKK